MNNDSPQFLAVGQVARLVQLTQQTIRKKCRYGEIDGAKNFGSNGRALWRIPVNSRFLQSQKIVSKPNVPFIPKSLSESMEIFNRL